MEYITLGNSDLQVSRICLGCMGFGDAKQGMHTWTLPYEDSKKIIQHALESGINFFDTAMAYQSGTSEIYLGKAIKELAKREDVIIATKFSPRTQEEINQHISGQQHVENCLNASLERLGMEYVDLYIYHMWDYHTPIEEIMEGLHRVIQQGKVRYIGISNCYAYQLAKANMIARANGWEEFISIQGHYNLIFREEEREMVPYCKEGNIALTPYSALASGRLAKKAGEQSKRLVEDQFAKGKYDASADIDLQIIKRVEELAEKRNVSMTEISLAWLLTKATSPVVGATKLHHIDGAVKAVDLKLSEDEINYLEELYKPHPLVGVMAQNK
ncbi:aldo/keto reductase [Absiella sp. AM54-8XD]|mgnify:CR=1 FL=1|jgi:1-deoxyxylulose-5-phosphate synthase|uniref:aldo/keto reductase n=1 Tax=unclassified Amedibacterium TaxID=3088137 RepID=UPI000E3FECE5|nr:MULTISPECIES: aldo/keto reductase [unclassified Absiella]RGC22462.1 aldo/keto reductase [Absiella sp. AM54-8XD]RGC51753.1 aldo/keto reductase [Absiella sp. AM29-15]